jgi:N6-adenosine-specific RNA methylase IME4
MRGKACSWHDMRKIRRILAERERLKGEYEALMRCADRTTVSTWKRAIEVMDAVPMRDICHTQPSHAREIARLAPRKTWATWVKRCEAEQLTVPQLRGALLADQGKRAAAQAERTAPTGKYRTLVVDPPWAYGNKSGRQRPDYAERMMDLETVAAFDLQRWVPDDACHLYLWVTDAYAGDVYPVIRAWGFEPKATLVWDKGRIGMGNYFRHQHELCVFAVKGNLRLKRLDASTVFTAPVGAHSEKPDAFYALVESCSPGPYLDVFARRRRAGWDVFGDEVRPEYQMRLRGNNASAVVGQEETAHGA